MRPDKFTRCFTKRCEDLFLNPEDAITDKDPPAISRSSLINGRDGCNCRGPNRRSDQGDRDSGRGEVFLRGLEFPGFVEEYGQKCAIEAFRGPFNN
jgi:hypothetical protein